MDGLRHAWIDASAGIAGDMLLGALLDAGAELAPIQTAIDAVVSGSVRVGLHPVTRAGMRAGKAEVALLVDDPPHRTWRSIRTMITDAGLAAAVQDRALRTFAVLAEAEGRVHGIPPEEVHFHEVGALDSIADVVGVCAALYDLGVESISVSEVALGSGQVRAAHGTMPVPVPAVAELARGWRVTAGGQGELTTPTGMALLAALAQASEELPAMAIASVGVGAGSKDFAGRANVTRVLIGESTSSGVTAGSAAVVLEANVDDLDPRLWPDVLTGLLAAGADDAWLSPITMKKGRPAHTLSVLSAPERADELRAMIVARTSTIGVRQSDWTKFALPRRWVEVEVLGAQLPIKIAHADGVITRATPEFEPVAALAAERDRPAQDVLAAAVAAAVAAGLTPGAKVPGTDG